MATRLYLPSSGSPPVSPAYDAGWEDITIAARLPCGTTKADTVMTQVVFFDSSPISMDILFRQYISPPLDGAQTISAQEIRFVIGALQGHGNNNMFTSFGVRVFSEDGLTLRSTLLAVTRDQVELITSLISRKNTPSSSSYSAASGDRIVIEIGTGGDPISAKSHDSAIRIGDEATNDLDLSDSDTDDDNPWVEFATDTLVFEGEAPPGEPADEKLRVVHSSLVWA